MPGTNLDGSYEVLIHASKSRHMTALDWAQAIDEIEITLKRFAGGVIIKDRLETTLATIPTASFYIIMTSRYPEETIKKALMDVALAEGGFSIAWLEIKDADYLVE